MKNIYFLALLLLLSTTAVGQVGIGTDQIDDGAILELDATDKGLLITRVALTGTSSPAPLPAHVAGMLVYNTATAGTGAESVEPSFYYNDGTQWLKIVFEASTPSQIVTVAGVNDPNTAGGTFNPNVQSNTDALYVANDGSTWIYDGTQYVTKEFPAEPWFDAASDKPSTSLGDDIYHLGSVSVGNGTASGRFSMSVGEQNTVTSQNSITVGSNNTANAFATSAFGVETRASGNNSATFGFRTISTGVNGFATGVNSRAEGNNSAAFGFTSVTTGINAFAANQNTVAAGNNSAVFGNNSRATGPATNSAVFGLSNVASDVNSFVAGANITLTPGSSNSIAFGRNISSATNDRFFARFNNGYRLWTHLSNNVGVFMNQNATSWSAISDRRAKDNIETLDYGLQEVMQLKPSRYNYKGVEKTSLGFIAQEVQEVVPEVVSQSEMGPEGEYLGVSYTELIPVLTKAIQEQQKTIETLQQEIETLKSQL